MRKVIPTNAMTIPAGAERVFKGIIYDVYHWQQEMFDGSYATFERLKRPDTVQIVAVKDDKIVIQKQRQPDWKTALYNIPGGRNDIEAEDELQAAQREMLEETGMTFATWRLLNVVQPNPKIDWFVYTFLATDFKTQIAPELDNGEQIETLLVPFNEAKKLLGSGKGRHCPKDFANASSLKAFLGLPEYKG